jgi:predicted esterase YcpF (UPF0227 family)
MTKDEALDLALKSLEHMLEDAKQERLTVEYWNECVDAITAIKQARSAPVQEPVTTLFGSLPVYDTPPVQEDWGPGPHECHSLTAAPVRELPDDELTQALIERDEAESTANELAQAIAQITGEDIGEHTSANFPWRNALDAAENWLCHPPAAQRQWVGLTDEEITALKHNGKRYISSQDFARAVEALSKEKNT